MDNFVKYAQYYNSLYTDKNYRKEADYINRLIKCYAINGKKTLLDIGCGTGEHDFCFVKNKYQVTGIDKSKEMIAIAKNKMHLSGGPEFYTGDIAELRITKKFDVAVALFHVMSYLTCNSILIKSLKNINNHLKKNGLFIFDFWYGPAVLIQKPRLKTKIIKNANGLIKRIAVPKLCLDTNTVDIHYKIGIKSIKSSLKNKVDEHHIMRYFFLPELYLMLQMTNFKVINCLEWMSLNRNPSKHSWSGVIIAQKAR